MNNLIQQMNAFMRNGESLNLKITKSNGLIDLVFTPSMGDAPSDLSTDAQSVRANLAMPIRLVGEASELDEAFEAKFKQVSNNRHSMGDSFDRLMERQNEAVKSASIAADKADDEAVEQTNKSTEIDEPKTIEKPIIENADSASLDGGESLL